MNFDNRIHLLILIYGNLSNVVPVKSKVKISQNCVAFSEYVNFNATQWGLDNVKQFMQFYVVISQNHGASMYLFLKLLQRGKFLKIYDFCSSKDGIRLDNPLTQIILFLFRS